MGCTTLKHPLVHQHHGNGITTFHLRGIDCYGWTAPEPKRKPLSWGRKFAQFVMQKGKNYIGEI